MPGAPNGSVLQYVGSWIPGQCTGAQDIIAAVTADLLTNGIAVRSQSNNSSIFQNSVPCTLSLAPFTVQLTLQVQNGLGFGDINDVIGIVRHWVLQESGSYPISDSIPSISVPTQSGGTGQTQQTGQPSPPDPGSNPSKGLWDTLSGLFTDTTSTIGITALLIGIGFLVAKKENWI